jgi:hypothetical protein
MCSAYVSVSQEEGWVKALLRLCGAFEIDNVGFDREKFLTCCGLENHSVFGWGVRYPQGAEKE